MCDMRKLHARELVNVPFLHTTSLHCRIGQSTIPYHQTQVSIPQTKSYFHYLVHEFSNSIGQLVIDALASRLGVRMSSDRAGYSGRRDILVMDTMMTLTLYKSSTRHSPLSKPFGC